jgi:hypothetical protein
MVQTTHNVTRPPDHLATEYLTYVWPSPILRTRSPTPVMILVAAHHVAPVTCTPWEKQTWFSTRNKNKGKTTKTSRIQIQTEASQILITDQTKVLVTWFLKSALTVTLNWGIKFSLLYILLPLKVIQALELLIKESRESFIG